MCVALRISPCWSSTDKTILFLFQVLCALSAEATGCPWPASQLEERPEPKGTEDSGDLKPGHEQPSATGELVASSAFAML